MPALKLDAMEWNAERQTGGGPLPPIISVGRPRPAGETYFVAVVGAKLAQKRSGTRARPTIRN